MIHLYVKDLITILKNLISIQNLIKNTKVKTLTTSNAAKKGKVVLVIYNMILEEINGF